MAEESEAVVKRIEPAGCQVRLARTRRVFVPAALREPPLSIRKLIGCLAAVGVKDYAHVQNNA